MLKQTVFTIFLLLPYIFVSKADNDNGQSKLPALSFALNSLSQVKGLTGQPFQATCSIEKAQFEGVDKNYTINFYQTDNTGNKPLLIGTHEVFGECDII